MWQTINFAELDAGIKFNYIDDLYARVKELHYTYVSEYVYTNYYLMKKTIFQIDLDLNLSGSACFRWMQVWNFPRRNPNKNNKQGIKV